MKWTKVLKFDFLLLQQLLTVVSHPGRNVYLSQLLTLLSYFFWWNHGQPKHCPQETKVSFTICRIFSLFFFQHWTIMQFSNKSYSSKHSLVLKTSWRRQDMSWIRLQNVFSVTIFGLPRRLEDVLKTSWKTKNCYAEDVLKTSSRHVFKTSSRHVFKTSWKT